MPSWSRTIGGTQEPGGGSSETIQRLDLQRQTLLADGSWTKWENVSSDENLKILDNLPEVDEELTPENVRPDDPG